MEEQNVKYTPVNIPEDALNEWETTKTVTLNGVMYVIPVGQPVNVPEPVAKVVQNWLDETRKARADYKKRMEELKEAFK